VLLASSTKPVIVYCLKKYLDTRSSVVYIVHMEIAI
jgi:hypothetical protein